VQTLTCQYFVQGYLRLADAYLALTSIRDALVTLQRAQASCEKAEDNTAIQRRMAELLQPEDGAKVLKRKHAMGFGDPIFLNTALYSFAPYGALLFRPDRRVAANAEYFAALTAGKDVEVVDSKKGRIVIARRAFKRGERIFEEPPLLAATTDLTMCSFCTRTICEAPIACPNCKIEQYCSVACRASAADSYHTGLCRRAASGVEALIRELDNASLAEYGHVILALKMIAMVKQRAGRGCQALDLMCSIKDQGSSVLSGYACAFDSLHAQFAQVQQVMGVGEDPRFDFEWFDNLCMALPCNAIGNISDHSRTGGSERMCEGGGGGKAKALLLMQLGSMCNHSCEPNCNISLGQVCG
jgi:hypothetical protein